MQRNGIKAVDNAKKKEFSKVPFNFRLTFKILKSCAFHI